MGQYKTKIKEVRLMKNMTDQMRERLEIAKLDCDYNIENYVRVLKSDLYRLLIAFMELQYSDIKINVSKNNDDYEFLFKVKTKKLYDIGSIID